MTRSLRVTALQLAAHARKDFARSLGAIVAAAREAARDSDLLVLPEGTFPSYVLGDEPLEEAATAAAIGRLAEIAAQTQTVIVVGAAVADGSSVRNGAVTIDADGSLAGRADKVFLWHFDRRWFQAGRELAPIRTAAGTLGVFVCADGRLPTLARALVDRGAEMLVMPTAWVTSGRNPGALENVQADLLGRVRAYENGVPFVAANKCGAELGIVAYCGKSQIVTAAGEVAAIAGERTPEAVRAAVALGEPRRRRSAAPVPLPRTARPGAPVRIAISWDRLSPAVDRDLALLEDAFALAPDDRDRFARLDQNIPSVDAGDDLVLDPAGLAAYRRAGYRLVVWNAHTSAEWTQRLARARALELRLYVVVFDAAAQRAFAVDPDGVIVAGTFADYRLASFTFDPRKTEETAVAPGTDIDDGLARVAAIVEREDTAAP